MIKKDFKPKRKLWKKLSALLLPAVMIAVTPHAARMEVRADVSALASSYNSDVSYIAYASEVEDQSQTNYCWAYMADAVLESYLMKTGAVSHADLSERDMISQLTSGSYAFTDLYSGGSYRPALAYWTRGQQYGPRLEQDGSITDYYVSETAELGRYDRDSQMDKQKYIQNIKNLVVKYGAVGVSVYFSADSRALMTKDGAYYYPQEYSPGVNHGVTVVGWDDKFSPQWFYNSTTTPQRPQNQGAFLVKNSWGRYDSSSIGGNTGYYWISYDNYFQDAFAVTQVTERSRLYDRLYEADYRGFYDFTSGSSYSQSYQLSGGAQWLTAVSTYVREGASYRFYVNGHELTEIGGIMAQSGYHTFQLSSPVSVYGTIELRAEVTGSDEAVPAANSADSRQPDGSRVCLKAFTRMQSGSGTNPSWNPGSTWNPGSSWNGGTSASTVSGVTLTPLSCVVKQGESRLFLAKVTGYGQPSQRISWQLSGNSSRYTRISDDGWLYVGEDEASSVLYIYANSYADSGHSASARVEVQKSGSPANPGNGSSGTNINGSGIVNPGTGSSNTNINGSGIVNPGTGSTGTSGTGGTIITPADAYADSSEDLDEDTGIEQIGTVNQNVYSFWEDGMVLYTKCTSKTRTVITIPADVTIGGQLYEVAAVDDGAVKNHKKVRAVTLGANISQIGDEAFRGCSQLKKIKIKSEYLEYIGEDAFRGIHAKAVIYVPESCLKEYRAMVRESGNSKVKVKAL